MEPRLQTRVQRYGWDAASEYYHDSWKEQLGPAHETLLKMAELTEGQRVIETACGTGLVTCRIADAVGPNGSVLATDLSQKMVDSLRQRVEMPGYTMVQVERMGAENLNVEDASFDAAICALGLMYVPDPRVAVTEMARCIEPGGTVTATVWGERNNCGWAEVFPIVDARVASEVCPMFFGTGAKGALVKDFVAAGLSDIKEHRQSEILLFHDAEELLTSVFLGGPVALAVNRFSRDVWHEVQSEFLVSVKDYKRADGSYEIPGEFVTVRGAKIPD